MKFIERIEDEDTTIKHHAGRMILDKQNATVGKPSAIVAGVRTPSGNALIQAFHVISYDSE
jgi:hypothetical protein